VPLEDDKLVSLEDDKTASWVYQRARRVDDVQVLFGVKKALWVETAILVD